MAYVTGAKQRMGRTRTDNAELRRRFMLTCLARLQDFTATEANHEWEHAPTGRLALFVHLQTLHPEYVALHGVERQRYGLDLRSRHLWRLWRQTEMGEVTPNLRHWEAEGLLTRQKLLRNGHPTWVYHWVESDEEATG